MALLSYQFNQISCKTLTLSARLTHHSILPTASPKFAVTKSQKPKPLSLTRAVSDDEWGAEAAGGTTTTAVEVEPTPSALSVEIGELKRKLIDSFEGSDRGLKAKSETRAQIVELITQLEALNPTSAPTEALPLLNGKWILAYTSYAGLFPLLSAGRLPLVKVEEISQTIDSENFTVQNSVKFSCPLATSSVSTNAKFEIRSPKRVQLKFEEGVIGTPQITDSIDIPEDFELFGQKIDLTPFKGLISSVQDTASSVVSSISSRPPLKIPISGANAESWLITTYLDDDVRISRGDAGSVFVFLKDGRPPLSF